VALINVLDKIVECEIEYVKCFCKADEQQDFIRFQDDLIPDMWYQNYTWVKTVKDNAALINLVESEILHSKNMSRNFCLLRFHALTWMGRRWLRHLGRQRMLCNVSCRRRAFSLHRYILGA